MHNGKTIEQLIATVERAEQQLHKLPPTVLTYKLNPYPAVSPWLCEWPRAQGAMTGVA